MPPGKLRLLITAGPTREYVDPVRYISNESSGKMGHALVAAAVQRGHRVTLVQGPVALPRPSGARLISVISAADMHAACAAAWPWHDALIMAAAVADYTPARRLPAKRKKSSSKYTLHLKPTVDILAELSRERRPGQVVVGFALEDHAARRRAAAKLRRKGLDAIVLNRPEALGAIRVGVEILVQGGAWECVPVGSKAQLGVRLVRLVEHLYRQS
ncbi:MAG: phosphopantothenoylcysteine decarboxylase [Planctomycetes bacterium]|nr:phosphopantothenoylcysteine decarboxylase [Planctomycetota bacterium]